MELKETGKKPIQHSQGVSMAKSIGCITFLECSALTQVGLSAVFEEAVRTAIQPKPEETPRKKFCTLL